MDMAQLETVRWWFQYMFWVSNKGILELCVYTEDQHEASSYSRPEDRDDGRSSLHAHC
ncbi:hypothetical protein BT63DRAFT_421028 [Microthyrium microscopicum]|uniref:Uncharacterized protein n=1 Tax=Microthyrium microscopicum TaxID=703497 RepID=A0A6A6UKN9_9PEZI|nr:hypothetical protein BT63DRAFT_421028 [Microthyrium microscopicum]